MLELNRILVPVDFSGASDAALRRAADLAERTGAELHVLHVVPGPYTDEPMDDLNEEDRAYYHRIWNQADDELTAFLDRVKPRSTQSKRVLSYGLPSRVILDYAEREGVDLVVMGTHGRRGLRRFFLGSVAEEVLRRGEISIMIVPEATAARKHFHLVLAPTDFSVASGWALPVAAELAALYGADLKLLNALEPVRYAETLTGVEIAGDLFPSLRSEAARRLEALSQDPRLVEAMADGFHAEAPVEGGAQVPGRVGYHLVEGRAAAAIVEVARAQDADAIVMAKHGLHGVERLLLGSVTERVCRLAPCAVLVLPIDEHEEASGVR